MNDLTTNPESSTSFNLLQIKNFFDVGTCQKLLVALRSAECGPATVYGASDAGTVNERMRKTTRIQPSPETAEFVDRMLMERKGVVEEHFQVSLTECEEPQFLRYGEGDFFVAHQDGGTGLLQFDQQRIRRVSVTIFLNDQSEVVTQGTYTGGTLMFHRYDFSGTGCELHQAVRGESGTLVAFAPETTHEVIPVIRGDRYSIACWYK